MYVLSGTLSTIINQIRQLSKNFPLTCVLGLRLLSPSKRELLLLICAIDTNCDVTSIYVRTVALIMKQVTWATAPRIHYAFRGRLVGLLVLTHCGVPPMPFLPQESSCIRVAGIAFANNRFFSVNLTSSGKWRAVTPAGIARV